MIGKRAYPSPQIEQPDRAAAPGLTPEREADLLLRIQRLEREIAERDEFIAAVGHELRNPVSPVMLQVRYLLDEARRAEGDLPVGWFMPRLETLLERCQRFLRTLERILIVARLSDPAPLIELEDVDLSALVREVSASLGRELAAARCALSLQAPGSVIGRWDRLGLEQIVGNLLTNAIRYGAGRPVEVSVDAGAAAAHLVVRDHGIGIAAEEQGRIFERYHRAPAARGAGGLGLGLWIVHRLSGALGGAVAVESLPGQGAAFTVTLPLQGPGCS